MKYRPMLPWFPICFPYRYIIYLYSTYIIHTTIWWYIRIDNDHHQTASGSSVRYWQRSQREMLERHVLKWCTAVYHGIPIHRHFLGKWWSAIKFQCTLFSDKPMWKIVGWMECIATKIMGQSRGPKILAIRGYNLYTFHPASIPLQGSSTIEQNKCIVNTWRIANYHPESKHFTLLQTKIDVENTPYL